MHIVLRLLYLLNLSRPLVKFVALDRTNQQFDIWLELRAVCCCTPYALKGNNGALLRCLDVTLASGNTYRVIASRRNARLLGVWL